METMNLHLIRQHLHGLLPNHDRNGGNTPVTFTTIDQFAPSAPVLPIEFDWLGALNMAATQTIDPAFVSQFTNQQGMRLGMVKEQGCDPIGMFDQEVQTNQLGNDVACGPEDLTVIPTSNMIRDYQQKYRVYFKSNKRQQCINDIPNPEVDKLPLFVPDLVEPTYAQLECRTGKCTREKLRKRMQTDRDLVSELKMEAAFLPRTPQLAMQLKQRARKWMAQFDCSLLTLDQQYKLVVRAVGAAMLISQEEEKVRTLLHSYGERELVRPAHNQCFIAGRTGTAAGTSLTRQPKKVSALGKFLKRKLIRGIRF
jgi:hypothetical protein